ncbi:DUF2461 domain-containing protein [Blastococcus sp. MG754426]|uniref:DUF2461 domain-containing protein n=1 Tax=unclassified Blastococcus TaxID=2619396 RepID=UPI001EEFB341|nr:MULTISPECIES: DUF2461 domain-containing protein [unclassified Blastococcus]MCF6509150.1 DUF2461 domain-containing protein [Blastococcus sp. MG754426]MCF6512898.1 DUF2461 domain-containing protein [Blastococcus sp. MG754427]
MTFDGFPDEGLVFYEGLEADNSKAYWTAHRTAYEAHVRAPMTALVEALAQEFGTAKVFRPYRDVRFSHDKTPYKNHQGAVVNPEGRGAGAWYVQISADGLTVAGGCWRLESDQVARYRRAVAEPLQGTRLAEEVSRLRAAGWRMEGERLVRVPAGYSAEDPRTDLLKHKTLHAARHWAPEGWLHTPEALERVRDAWRDLRSLNAWFADNVGATTKEPRRR